MIKINKQRVYNFYNKKKKWLGLVDNKTLFYFGIYVLVILKIVSIFSISYSIKIYIMAIFILPVIILVILNLQEESIIDKFKDIILFYIFRGYYLKTIQTYKDNIVYVKNVEK